MLGLVGDLVLIPLGVVLVRRMIPADVLADCRVRAEVTSEPGKPVFWTAAVVIVVLWLVSAYLTYMLVRDRL